MASQSKKAKAALSAGDLASLAKANPYIQKLIEDAQLRDNLQQAVQSGRSAYGRLSNGKAAHRALLEDKKLQKDLRQAVEAFRDASTSITEAPKKRARKGLSFGRKLLIVGIGGGLALAGSEKLRSKVLDTLFGKEEEFQYTPPASTPPSQPNPSVTAA